MFNPVIVRRSGPYEAEEGCLSLSGTRRTKRFETISYIDVLAKGLHVMDSTATSLCMDNDMPILVFDLTVPGNISRILKGEDIGTTVTAEG